MRRTLRQSTFYAKYVIDLLRDDQWLLNGCSIALTDNAFSAHLQEQGVIFRRGDSLG